MTILVLIVLIWATCAAVKSSVRSSRMRRAKQLQEIQIEGKHIKSYVREIEKATSVSSFLNGWKNLKQSEDKLLLFRKKISDKGVREGIDETCQMIEDMNDEFQRMLCSAIERMRRRFIREMKTTYKYSDYMKEQLYQEFEDEIQQGESVYSSNTKRIANSVLNEVAWEAGKVYSISDREIYSDKEYSDPTSFGEDIDHMDGHQFEYFCADLLRKNGFENVQVTKGSGDQGIDILAEKDEIRYAIQCKCFSTDLGNTSVQEVFAGKQIYGCQVAAVLTNRFFTDGAKEAAKATGVLLWDRNRLLKFMQNA